MVDPLQTALSTPEPSPFIEDENRLLERLIQGDLIGVSYHPVVDLRSRTLFAYEALCRPQDGYFRTPEELLESAVRCGRMGELGRHLRKIATINCAHWPLFLNLDPHEFGAEYLVRPDDPVFLHKAPVYLEISETVPMDFSEDCVSVLGEIRSKGVLLSIDDFGAGSSSLKNIVELQPDIVKLDRELVMNCLPESREFELLHAVTDLCHRMKAKVIAEGIETPDELKAVIAAGIDYGQGFLLSLPQDPPPPFIWPPEVPLEEDTYRREFLPSHAQFAEPTTLGDVTNPPKSQDQPCPTDEASALEDARRTICLLQAELDETREERSNLAEKLKRLSLAPTAAKPKRERAANSPGSVSVSANRKARGNQSNEDEALEFLRRLEESNARTEDPE